MRGSERLVTVTRQVPCATCTGAGQLRTAEARCRQCHGSGNVRWARGHMVFTKACTGCGGTGRERHLSCAVCGGHGRVVRSDSVPVRVPAGLGDGTRLRVAERGHAGARGGRPGDLYVDVHVRPHRVLRREGADLHMVVPIAVHEAALGTRVELPSFDGPVKLRVPPGTQGGQRFRISGRGAVTISGGRGDLWAEVRVTLPAMLDERSKELMREFARLHQGDVRQELVKQLQAEG
ncbi:MAG: J domain-containing protein [Acidobacteriota bacterium]|nr:J domain-containing protein [Acidobacteriota bacterium]